MIGRKWSEGRFVLFRASNSGREYFMYKAADGESGGPASLDSVPLPDGYRLPRLVELGIVPRGHGGHYLVAALCLDKGPLNYRLHIYSSEDETWTSIRLRNPCPEVSKVVTSKVIALGEGVQAGLIYITACWSAIFVKRRSMPMHPLIHSIYIPLPDPLPGNGDQLEALGAGHSTRWFRDLTCVDGTVKFIEMEHRVIITPDDEKPSDPSEKELLYDSDLIISRKRKRKDMDEKPKQLKARYSDSDGQMAAVDLGKKTVKALVPYSFATHDPYVRA
ncbi:hypothetical protein BAE44_0022544 [Dichanthelium oligosanthes]|uniref:DUF1618 domain-containing protein n=1 Tax=Dichanthelium oligosanthes TaxID=888268 RepID=A0A1E5UU90_9POAL|nr:hypothetical protein BAE44_0022544 [Dichanthelium oligosanthes]